MKKLLENIKKYSIEILLSSVAFIIMAVSLGYLIVNTVKQNNEQKEEYNEQQEEYSTQEEKYNEQETIEYNHQFLMDKLKFESSDAVLGASTRLTECGVNKITNLEVIDDSDYVYILRVTDDKGQTFKFNISYNGSIGPILDTQGNYLYTPID